MATEKTKACTRKGLDGKACGALNNAKASFCFHCGAPGCGGGGAKKHAKKKTAKKRAK